MSTPPQPRSPPEALLLSTLHRDYHDPARDTWATTTTWIDLAMARRLRNKKATSAGERHSLVITAGDDDDGQQSATRTAVWSFGHGAFGVLGHGGRDGELVPRRIEALDHVLVRRVAAGQSHSMALSHSGELFTWGGGARGKLGHDNLSPQSVPKLVEGITTPVTDIAAGGAHSVAVVQCQSALTDAEAGRAEDPGQSQRGGVVFTWGWNSKGALGLGDHGDGTDRLVPTEVPFLNRVTAVAAGALHSLALEQGVVMTCGRNLHGRLGLEDMHRRTYVDDDRDTFTPVSELPACVVDMDAGLGHSVAVTLEGRVYTWGREWTPKHGVDVRRSIPTRVHFTEEDGEREGGVGGGGEGGECGGGRGSGRGGRGGLRSDVHIDVVQVAAGRDHVMARTSSGDLYAWGVGESGQLGRGDAQSSAKPQIVGGIGGAMGMAGGNGHSLVTTVEGRVLSFGANRSRNVIGPGFEPADGRLGLGGEMGEVLTPEVVNIGAVAGNDDKLIRGVDVDNNHRCNVGGGSEEKHGGTPRASMGGSVDDVVTEEAKGGVKGGGRNALVKGEQAS